MSKRYQIIDGVKKCVSKNKRGFRNKVWLARYGQVLFAPCCYCKKMITFIESTLEHLVEVKNGGRDTLDNCDIACWECNQKRSGNLPGQRRDFNKFWGMGLPDNRPIDLGESLDIEAETPHGKVNDQGTDIRPFEKVELIVA